MKRLLSFSVLVLFGAVVYAAFPGNDLVPPTQNVHIYEDTSGKINFVDSSTGPVTLANISNSQLNQSSITVQGSITIPSAYGLTVAQLLVMTPNTTGQIVFCRDCTNTLLVISTGNTGPGQWAGVVNSTGSVLQKPK